LLFLYFCLFNYCFFTIVDDVIDNIVADIDDNVNVIDDVVMIFEDIDVVDDESDIG